MIILAIDFDGTLVADRFPEIGPPLFGAFESVRKLRENGYKLILWTCRTDLPERAYLTEAVEFCRKQGVEFDAVNDNLPDAPFIDKGNCRKVYADRYIDDKSILPEWGAFFK
jgi:hypothetical protein